ncbi:uncharacterized protein FOMMEDRAFT_29137 [Fomitiporia mediterranea MF3/22]|uniref:uncharacterized protein n=1 Tax=Fomitiporia mediterranea (strain MF3/22) TaxID=694068 RepID=UPI0004409257|nr:uncharacterized protein FOMMEDRAFT_29137 [Fomitiporia mediterranea MF3/22]EJD02023.1 hypothetical protein FOMMEDRAFT_29137 [Fomitiporia mediterranea MF3/22]
MLENTETEQHYTFLHTESTVKKMGWKTKTYDNESHAEVPQEIQTIFNYTNSGEDVFYPITKDLTEVLEDAKEEYQQYQPNVLRPSTTWQMRLTKQEISRDNWSQYCKQKILRMNKNTEGENVQSDLPVTANVLQGTRVHMDAIDIVVTKLQASSDNN